MIDTAAGQTDTEAVVEPPAAVADGRTVIHAASVVVAAIRREHR